MHPNRNRNSNVEKRNTKRQPTDGHVMFMRLLLRQKWRHIASDDHVAVGRPCLQQQLTFQPVWDHLQRRLLTSRCLPGLINSLSEVAPQYNSKTTQQSIQQYKTNHNRTGRALASLGGQSSHTLACELRAATPCNSVQLLVIDFKSTGNTIRSECIETNRQCI